MASRIKGITVEIGIRYNKLRKFRKKKETWFADSDRMKLRHTILKGVCKPCLRRLYN